MQDLPDIEPGPLFDDAGYYKLVHHVTEAMVDSELFGTQVIDYQDLLLLHNQNVVPSKADYDQYQSKLAWLPISIIEQTFARTTQFYRMPMGTYLKKRYKSYFWCAMCIIKVSLLLQIQSTLIHLLLTAGLLQHSSLLALNHW